MRTHKISEKQFVLDCINKEFSIVGAELHFNTFESLKEWANNNKEWYSNYSFATEEQYEEWKNYFITHFYDWKPKYISKKRAEHEFSWFDLSYGFKNDWYGREAEN